MAPRSLRNLSSTKLARTPSAATSAFPRRIRLRPLRLPLPATKQFKPNAGRYRRYKGAASVALFFLSLGVRCAALVSRTMNGVPREAAAIVQVQDRRLLFG